MWNKSNREHAIVGTSPDDVRREADAAVKALGWKGSYYVDADHIGLATVERFIASSDFYTIDVADYIGRAAGERQTAGFISDMAAHRGALRIPGVEGTFAVTDELLLDVANKYLYAIEEAGKVYRLIESKKGKGTFIPEISLDEAEKPQTPIELFFVLAAIAREGVPVQTIAPKFTGTFPKGIDYVGDAATFAREFEDDVAVIAHAVRTFGLPANLKLSVHSGSDKFSIYPAIHAAMKKFDAGIHLKTAGTTWLEEVIGLAGSGADGLAMSREIYRTAFARFDELCKPYLTVLAIDRKGLPDPKNGGRLERGRVRRRAPARTLGTPVQRPLPPADPRRIQDRGGTGRVVHVRSDQAPGRDRRRGHPQPLRTAHAAALPRPSGAGTGGGAAGKTRSAPRRTDAGRRGDDRPHHHDVNEWTERRGPVPRRTRRRERRR